MSFQDLQLLNWGQIMSGPGTEQVVYISMPDSGHPAETTVAAQVSEGDHSEVGTVGPIRGPVGKLPVHVCVLKAAIPTPRAGRDKVRVDGVEYLVKEVVLDNGVVLELYCAR